VRIEADKAAYPTLLSNGNLTESGDLPDGKHFAVWVDPHPKPAYLFALCAGKYESIHDEFVTRAGARSRSASMSIQAMRRARATPWTR
jgi:aminopeptidase N